MPPQQAKSNLLAGLAPKLKASHEKHKNDETKYGPTELPPIENGIAHLKEVKFGKFESGEFKGQVYFMASAIVVEPEYVGKIKVGGNRTQIGPEPLCDTPNRTRKTLDEHYAWVLNELRKLGVNTATVSPDSLESVAAILTKQRPHISFRTWKGKPATEGRFAGQEPKVNHQWNGVIQYTHGQTPSAPGGQATTQDDTPIPDSVTSPGKGKGKGKSKPALEPKPEPEPVAEFDETTGDLSALVDAANSNDKSEYDPAQDRLLEMAKAHGISEEDAKGADTWQDLADMIVAAMGGSSEEDSAEPANEWEPQEGEVYKYKPMGPKGRATQPVDCEVLSVNTSAKTVELKNLVNTKVKYAKVPWDDLEMES